MEAFNEFNEKVGNLLYPENIQTLCSLMTKGNDLIECDAAKVWEFLRKVIEKSCYLGKMNGDITLDKKHIEFILGKEYNIFLSLVHKSDVQSLRPKYSLKRYIKQIEKTKDNAKKLISKNNFENE